MRPNPAATGWKYARPRGRVENIRDYYFSLFSHFFSLSFLPPFFMAKRNNKMAEASNLKLLNKLRGENKKYRIPVWRLSWLTHSINLKNRLFETRYIRTRVENELDRQSRENYYGYGMVKIKIVCSCPFAAIFFYRSFYKKDIDRKEYKSVQKRFTLFSFFSRNDEKKFLQNPRR